MLMQCHSEVVMLKEGCPSNLTVLRRQHGT